MRACCCCSLPTLHAPGVCENCSNNVTGHGLNYKENPYFSRRIKEKLNTTSGIEELVKLHDELTRLKKVLEWSSRKSYVEVIDEYEKSFAKFPEFHT